ncbi:MAG: DnaJ domain-containing protein [Acidobacteria bacterium]|nr:DnaJ domain-containing protein [Acidobacteriota bacterium]
MNRETFRTSDPRILLGIAPEATDDEIRAAYLRKIREYPPDRHPEEFERVRDAYEQLRDRRRRVEHTLFSCDPESPLESLLHAIADDRKYVGIEPWLAALKENN